MKPAFSYFGAKQKIANKLIPLIPRTACYIEPYAGSSSVFFSLPIPDIKNRDHFKCVINDIDLRIYKFYKVLMDPKTQEELLHKIEFTPYHEEVYKTTIAILNNINSYTDLEVAWAFFVNINMSYANKLCGGFGRSIYGFNGAASWRFRCKNNLENVIKRLDGVYFTCKDAIDCLKDWESPQTFAFLDPPYVNTEQGHYKGYTQEDFDKLINYLKNCQSSFILTTYDNPSIPEEWERFEIKTKAHVSGKGRVRCDRSKSKEEKDCSGKDRTEIVLRVIRNQNVRPEIKKLFDSGKFDCFTGEHTFTI
jgi:DNA adenine methylase